MKQKYEKQNFEKIINESYTLSEVLDKLKLRKAGGNYKTINKYINLYNIDISHFLSNEQKLIGLKQYSFNNKLKYNDLFVENCIHKRSTVKRYIINNYLLKYECIMCGQDENWMNKKITLILDHINGIHNDNRITNLRFVCPNCNATLDTHCGKNKKQEKINKRKNNKEQYNKKQEQYIELIIKSNIDFSKYGWSGQVAKIINQKPQKVNQWMKRYMSDFYNNQCFKRNKK